MSETVARSTPESSDDTLQLNNTLQPIKTHHENNNNNHLNSSTVSHEEDDGYRTPTSAEHRIPEPLVCPPAPRKPRPVACKRRRPDSGFLHVIQPEEIEDFFRRHEKAAATFMRSVKRLVVVKKGKRVSAA